MKIKLFFLFFFLTCSLLAEFDYKRKPRSFNIVFFNNWEIYVDKSLTSPSPEMEKKTLKLLRKTLTDAEKILPKGFLLLLKKSELKFFIMNDKYSLNEGMSYVRNNQSSWDNSFPRRMETSVVIHNPYDFVAFERRSTRNIIHELAHFYHLDVLGLSYNPIWNNFNRAQKIYKGSYAGRNHLEYFAETSADFFLRRKLLEQRDPTTARFMKLVWATK